MVVHVLYLKQTAGHRKDPADHLQDLTQIRQERQPAEGKSHQHSQSDSHEQEKPTGKRSTDRQGSAKRAIVPKKDINNKAVMCLLER